MKIFKLYTKVYSSGEVLEASKSNGFSTGDFPALAMQLREMRVWCTGAANALDSLDIKLRAGREPGRLKEDLGALGFLFHFLRNPPLQGPHIR